MDLGAVVEARTRAVIGFRSGMQLYRLVEAVSH